MKIAIIGAGAMGSLLGFYLSPLAEVWLLDLAAAELVRYQVPREGGYQRLDRPLLDQPLELAALPGVGVGLRALFAS